MNVLGESIMFNVRDAKIIPSTVLHDDCAFVYPIDISVEDFSVQGYSVDTIEDEHVHMIADMDAIEFMEEGMDDCIIVGDRKMDTMKKLELKKLPSHRKYVYLEEGEQKSVIIFAQLTTEQEGKLIEVLKKQKKANGWSLGDIHGISPSTYMRQISLE